MSERNFHMRLSCRYEGSENDIVDLKVQVFEEGEWQDFELNVNTAGFLVFVYAVFACQHLYLRTNAAERRLRIDSATGSIHMMSTEDWDLKRLQVSFDVKLGSGRAAKEDVDYIIGRMKQCPVSRNIRDIEDERTIVDFS
jgi:hypothetical protein